MGILLLRALEKHTACEWVRLYIRRWLTAPLQLAFPGMSDAELVEAASEQKDLFAAAGFAPGFVTRALATPNKDMWRPSSDELFRAGAITAVSHGNNFAASGYGGNVTREEMAAMLTKVLPALGTMKERLPTDYASIIDGFYDSYVSGLTETEIFAAARSKLLLVLALHPSPVATSATMSAPARAAAMPATPQAAKPNFFADLVPPSADPAPLGSPTASAAKMSPSLWGQLDGLLQEQYKRCWSFVGLGGRQKYVPEIHVQYTQDGSLIGRPVLLNPPSDPNLRNLEESAMRAVRRCDPLRIPAQYQPYYDQWKGRIVRFDPEEML